MTSQMPPKTLNLVECKRCGAQWFKGDALTLKVGDLISIQPSAISKCTLCEDTDPNDKRIPGSISRHSSTIPRYRMGNTNNRK